MKKGYRVNIIVEQIIIKSRKNLLKKQILLNIRRHEMQNLFI